MVSLLKKDEEVSGKTVGWFWKCEEESWIVWG